MARAREPTTYSLPEVVERAAETLVTPGAGKPVAAPAWCSSWLSPLRHENA